MGNMLTIADGEQRGPLKSLDAVQETLEFIVC